MKKVTYFDVEYANCKNKSICQLGVMCEDYSTGDAIFPEKNIYINPEDGFDPMCVRIHGITKDRVSNEPTFPHVWSDISNYFTNAVVIGHNVRSADLDALVKNLIRYDLEIPELYYVDTLEIARAVIPSCYVQDYSVSSLCNFFDIDIESEHDAFDDACTCKDLLKALIRSESLDIDSYVHHFEIHQIKDFNSYVSNPVLRKSISDLYGVIKGIVIDKKINKKELAYIESWKLDHKDLMGVEEFKDFVAVIDNVLEDEVITKEEATTVDMIVSKFFENVKTTPETLATQILNGILKGVSADGVITTEETVQFEKWLYENSFLKGHFPYDQIVGIVEKILEDGEVSPEESSQLISEINRILDPVSSLGKQIACFSGKNVCLSGCFKFGEKAEVSVFIESKGGIIDSNVKKTTNILIVGAEECESFSNGTYGTKVKKAMELKQKGCNIVIVKESDCVWE